MTLSERDLNVLRTYTGLLFNSRGILQPKLQYAENHREKLYLWNEERDILKKTLSVLGRILDDYAYQYKVLRLYNVKSNYMQFKRLYRTVYDNKKRMDALNFSY